MSVISSHSALNRLFSSTLQTRLITARTLVQEQWQLDTAWLESFKNKLNTADVITFDVFDTALTRIVETPADVFALMEDSLTHHYGPTFNNFALERETAEQVARHTAWHQEKRREITQHDIYTALAGFLPQTLCSPQHLAALEREIEHHVCLATPEIQQAVTMALQAKRHVLFVSDMYLSGKHICQLLTQAGYPAPLTLLASSDTLHTKAEGHQWRLVKNKYPAGAKILHIGDNQQSDVASPNKHGIATHPYLHARSAARKGGPLCPAILPFSIASRVAQLTHPRCTAGQNTMAQLGASWGALVVGAYAKWLATQAAQVKPRHIFFCARDGALPYAAWKTLGLDAETQIPSSYLYLSRKALNFGAAATSCSPEHLSPAALETLTQTYRPNSVKALLTRIGFTEHSSIMQQAAQQFGSLQHSIFWSTPNSVMHFKAFLQHHAAEVYARLCIDRDNATAYLLQQGAHQGPIALVDVGWHGTMQASIAQLLRHAGYVPQIYGFYCGLWNRAQRNRPIAGWLDGAFGNDFLPDNTQYALRNAVAILENLFTANHGTTVGYQNHNGTMVPLLAHSEIESAQHARIIQPFQTATLATLKQLSATGQAQTLLSTDLTLETAFASLARLALSPTTNELHDIGSLEHCGDISHASYLPLVHPLTHPTIAECIEETNKSEWPMATALTLLAHGKGTEKTALTHALTALFSHYDTRTRAQLQ